MKVGVLVFGAGVQADPAQSCMCGYCGGGGRAAARLAREHTSRIIDACVLLLGFGEVRGAAAHPVQPLQPAGQRGFSGRPQVPDGQGQGERPAAAARRSAPIPALSVTADMLFLQAYKAVVNDATIFKLELPMKQKG